MTKTINSSMGLTMTLVVEAQSLNYDEGFGNLSTLKKIRRAGGNVYSFASRQSLRYSIVKQGKEQFDWKLADTEPQGAGDARVVQFSANSTILESEEIDLFGYMKTSSGNTALTRIAPVRTTPLISLEPFYNDIEFLNNKWLADRANVNPNIANIEQHRSLYKYTVCLDLDRVGNENWNVFLPEDHRSIAIEDKNIISDRVREFLEIIKTLYRDIRGRREDLKPFFVIGGVYEVKNPFFMNLIKIRWDKGEPLIVHDGIKDILNASYRYKKDNGNHSTLNIQDKTFIGLRSGFWKNEDNLKSLNNQVGTPEEAIDNISHKACEFYGVKEDWK